MFALLSEFIRNVGRTITVIVMDREHMEHPKTFSLDPTHLFALCAGVFLGLMILITSLVLFTPLRYSLPGYGSLEMRREALENTMRISGLQDSLRLQTEYVSRLRDIFLGNVAAGGSPAESVEPDFDPGASLMELPLPVSSEDWEQHQQPAFAFDELKQTEPSAAASSSPASNYLSALSFPFLPPVSGIITRGFDARTGHFAVDVAAETGSALRSIGDGYVILADWVNDGGQVIAIAHAGGYISVFKHNSSLLKNVGERVRDREVIALSGNTGEITTGPHAHFELWQNGLAQNPRDYVLGW
ncbi:MAG: M23 family metallopeptidase [Bacteroidetes bacterium]|nr:M23 family metallopeptidase [Bacteroidota bacterium]MDA1332892.1 M23 family metallopeptidase [Bacteroidota bacterium]